MLTHSSWVSRGAGKTREKREERGRVRAATVLPGLGCVGVLVGPWLGLRWLLGRGFVSLSLVSCLNAPLPALAPGGVGF